MRKTFKQYDQENPGIYLEFKKIALNLIAKGRTHYGAKGIVEVIRYNRITASQGYDQDPENSTDFKINNNYAPDYARKFMAEFPQYPEFFKTRVLKNVRQ